MAESTGGFIGIARDLDALTVSYRFATNAARELADESERLFSSRGVSSGGSITGIRPRRGLGQTIADNSGVGLLAARAIIAAIRKSQEELTGEIKRNYSSGISGSDLRRSGL